MAKKRKVLELTQSMNLGDFVGALRTYSRAGRKTLLTKHMRAVGATRTKSFAARTFRGNQYVKIGSIAGRVRTGLTKFHK